jgi:hypothetical protein
MLLDPHVFRATIVHPVERVTDIEHDAVDIWPYLDTHDAGGLVLRDVECVYRGADGRYDHAVIPTETPNTIVAVVVDRRTRIVVGHHVLYRNDVYLSLPASDDSRS